MRVFILASGPTDRWNGGIKQLECIKNKTVLQRQVDMVRRYGYHYNILSHHARIKSKFEKVIIPENSSTFLNTVKSSRDLWKAENEVIFLLSDVIFTKNAFNTCVHQFIDKSFQFYGSFEEHFCFRFTNLMYSRVIEHIDNILALGLDGTVWELYRSLVGIPLDKDWTDRWFRTLITDKTDDIDYPEDYKKKIQTGYFDDEEFNL